MLPRLSGALLLASLTLSGCAASDRAATAGEMADTHVSGDGSGGIADTHGGIADTQVFASSVLGEAVNVRIAPPTADSAEPWPVIYVLDGQYLFGLVTDTVHLLNLSGLLPGCIVVGVDVGAGAASADLDPAARGRHFTPTPSTVATEATGLQRAGSEHGGADAFLAFLTDELSLFVGAQYPIDANRRVLLGDGLAGLFVLHALFVSGAFTHYLAVSPALWWDDGIAFREEAAFALRGGDRTASLFLAAGAREGAGTLALVENVEALTGRLRERAYPSLRHETVVFDGESQGSVTPAAVSRGLRFLLQPE